ncbi:unnamed protein product [Symbiodinium necroappetens]|uniref:Endonuclease/exonuclease/phosphatase domain-containing protein n=1 Tax=Symbiodinium necroappetens TaxID=1628268 RepID=A0A812UFC5_9DINO|nr:unnamed protein product [Symbiodinium necroappetens]
MPIICRVCGAAGEHLTVHCPDRQDPRPCDRQDPGEGKGGISKGRGKRGGATARGRGTGPSQEVYKEIVAEALASDEKPWIRHKCSDGEAATRRFMRIRPSAVDWTKFGWLFARGSQETTVQQKKNVGQLQADWKELSSRHDLSKTDLADGLKQLALRHGVHVGKWLFFLKPADMDRVWPALVWALSNAALGEGDCMKVGGGKEYVCCVYVRNCFDAEQAESLRRSLQDLLGGLVARVELVLKPDAYSYCGIYRGNPWKLSTSVASCMAVEEECVEVLLPILQEAKSLHHLGRRIMMMMQGLVEKDAAFILGYRSVVFCYSEFKRMHMANFGLLADLCVHGLITGTRLLDEMEQWLLTDSVRLPPPSTWAFVLQSLGNMAQRLADSHPRVSRSLDSFVQDCKVSPHSRLSILSLNVSSDEKQRELRTAVLLSALQQLREQLGPVVCCFQEVTRKVAMDVQRALPTWESSDPGDGSSIKGHGLLVMAPPELDARFSDHRLQSKDCKLVVAEFPGLAVGNVHLSGSPELRERQLADCAQVMQQWSDMLLVGDFSMNEDVLHRCVLQNQLPDFTDLWPVLRDESGITVRCQSNGKGQKRTDRALAKLPRWKPVDMQLMFDQPLVPGPFLLDVLPSMYSNVVHLKPEADTNATFVSDHLGLLTTIEQNPDVSRSQGS